MPGSSVSQASTIGNAINSPFDPLKRLQSNESGLTKGTPRQLVLHMTEMTPGDEREKTGESEQEQRENVNFPIKEVTQSGRQSEQRVISEAATEF